MAELKRSKMDPNVKNLLELFTFQGQVKRYKPVHGARLPLAPMLESLRALPDEAWGAYAFGRDPLCGKFTPQQRLELSQQARACGRAEAQRLLDAHAGPLLPSLAARELGLKIARPNMPNGGGQVIFAQFEEPNQITIFMDTVDKANALLEKRPDLRALLGAVPLEQVLTAHELFHAVELQNKDRVFTQTYHARLWQLGPLHNDSRIACLSEIAGMEFARTLLDLPFSPYLYDVFFVSLYNAHAAGDLYRSICRLCGHPSVETTLSVDALTEALELDEA